MTKTTAKTGWLAVTLAIVLGWSTTGIAGPRPKMDRELAKRAMLTAGESRVIIETTDHAAADDAIKYIGGKAGRKLKTFPAQVAVISNAAIDKLTRHPHVKFVYDDRPTGAAMHRVNLTTGAAYVQTQLGYSGAGIGVAVIDSGVTSWHDDLTANGGGQRVSAFVDFVNGRTSSYDDYGHGTHVAGIVAGNGYDSSGEWTGVAPAAEIVALKVLDGNGTGYMSDIIAALDWVVANKGAYNIRVVNMSVGAAVRQSYKSDPLTLAAKSAVDSGIVVVAAAGNLGKNSAGQTQYGGITAPGNAPWVITVGASNSQGTSTRSDDTIADFSSRGPSAIDYAAKPDLVAPGTGVVSLAAAESLMYQTRAANLVAGTLSLPWSPYLSLSGTSMAAPVVSGTVALMLQANPSLTPNLVKAILEYTSQSYQSYNALQQGAGFLNSYGAVTLARYLANPQRGSRYPIAGSWSRHIIWGNRMIAGGVLMPGATAWAQNIVWGTALGAAGDNIVWGTSCGDDKNCSNIVWGSDVGVVGNNIVWGTAYGLQPDNIVWGTTAADNIVWGTATDNIVWGTTAGSLDNIVWGTDCGGANCYNVVWGTTATNASGDNIVWGTAVAGDNIVWGTSSGGDNIVWGTNTDVDNIVWGTSSGFDDPSAAGTLTTNENLDEILSSLTTPPPDVSTSEGGTIGGGL